MPERRHIFLLRIALTLLGAFAAAQLCLWLRTPLPWMLGPLIATSLASILGAPTASAGRLRNGGQWIIFSDPGDREIDLSLALRVDDGDANGNFSSHVQWGVFAQ